MKLNPPSRIPNDLIKFALLIVPWIILIDIDSCYPEVYIQLKLKTCDQSLLLIKFQMFLLSLKFTVWSSLRAIKTDVSLCWKIFARRKCYRALHLFQQNNEIWWIKVISRDRTIIDFFPSLGTFLPRSWIVSSS